MGNVDFCLLQVGIYLVGALKISLSLSLIWFVVFFVFLVFFLGPHPKYMEVPRLGCELELQLLAYTTATPL